MTGRLPTTRPVASASQENHGDQVTTPRARTVARRSVFWIGVAVVAILVVAATMLLTRGGASSGIELDPANPAPTGAKATAEVLRDQGVDVILPGSYGEAMREAKRQGTTLAVFDPSGYLTDERLFDLVSTADSTVILAPTFAQLRVVAPDVFAAGVSDEPGALDADCDLPAAERAQTISPGATFRVNSETDAITCFPADTDGFAVVQLPEQNGTLTLVGPSELVSNESVILHGNAAFALGLLGETGRLVWYLPSIADVEASGPPDVAQLTPNWLVPTTSLLALTALVAMFWRGRRFGPLVAENLPVTVPAGETLEGRARLYQRISARTRAIDALRIGAVGRLGRVLGLSRHATVYEVADACASALGRPRDEIRGVLVDILPQSERDVVSISDALANLERDTAAAVDPRPPSRPS
ncbi:DUF4350 domain-containing protein [Mycetocola zhadangensis]|uniref:DUF4350 domain-containing protein n=1 Tax=Mycetocola zhadangensis TaxID=1164595 RepID=A0A3L7ITJ4_9MICO|nr:DUF4350 domain-containing protein [Mycetocola zhadangensis]RLQ81505.1 DUF4350 domain-containing protein [Mycetocola zhadangensis]RLQ82459.1 DUF4350 domain-containing protein [Mycetocola zhadangensis]GGF01154.1 membrane protein [Mycetocola zhadangensis]